MTEKQQKKFISNLKRFTFPLLAIFFGQLALGVEFEKAFMLMVFAGYAVTSDYFKKAK